MKKHGFTLIELMAVIVIACIMILIGNGIIIQCLSVSKNTENNTLMEDKYRNIIANIEKDVKESEIVESYKGKNINIKNIGQVEELICFKKNKFENISYIYILEKKSNLKELHLIKINDSDFDKGILEAKEDKFIEDSIQGISINKSDEIGNLMDLKVDLKIMKDEKNYESAISKTNFVFKEEIVNKDVSDDFLERTSKYTLNVLNDENSESEKVFSIKPKGNYFQLFFEKHVWINGEQKVYEIRLRNDLTNDIHFTNTTIYSQSRNRNSVDVMGYDYPNEFRKQKAIKGPNLKFDLGECVISYSNSYRIIRNNSMISPYELKDNKGKNIGISENIGENKNVILINGDLIIKSTEHIDSAYIYCTGKIIIDTKASVSITNSKLIADKGIIINDVSSLNIVGNEKEENMFKKDKINNVMKKYIVN